MPRKRDLLIIAAGVLLLTALPYLIAGQVGGEQQFGGFLINPIDGHSYLAKMQEGYRGSWKFTLPFTAEPGRGAYLFLFYLMLGHVAKWLQLPLLIVFHGARILSGVFLIWAINRLARTIFQSKADRTAAFLLILLGSGLGWIAVLAGLFTSDFWVAEAFPFLSIYTNPHFTAGLALMIFALLPGKKRHFLPAFFLGLAISVIQPFGVVILLLVLVADAAIWLFEDRPSWKALFGSDKVRWLLGLGVGGGPVIVYQYWVIIRDPVLSLWHAQNQTPTPGVIDLLLAFSPSLVLGIFGIKKAWQAPKPRKLVIWAGISALLIFMPWSLQRRFLTGIYVPLAALCIFGLDWLSDRGLLSRRVGLAVVFALSLPTNIIVLASGIQAAVRADPRIFIDIPAVNVLDWIERNTKDTELIIAERDMGLLIPSATGRRVVYGHPFETAEAEQEGEWIDSFFLEDQPPVYYQEALDERKADFVLLSSDSSPSLRTWLENHWISVFSQDERELYRRKGR